VGTALLLHSGNARDEGARMNSGAGEKKEEDGDKVVQQRGEICAQATCR
jgi:hypothetical protein